MNVEQIVEEFVAAVGAFLTTGSATLTIPALSKQFDVAGQQVIASTPSIPVSFKKV